MYFFSVLQLPFVFPSSFVWFSLFFFSFSSFFPNRKTSRKKQRNVKRETKTYRRGPLFPVAKERGVTKKTKSQTKKNKKKGNERQKSSKPKTKKCQKQKKWQSRKTKKSLFDWGSSNNLDLLFCSGSAFFCRSDLFVFFPHSHIIDSQLGPLLLHLGL